MNLKSPDWVGELEAALDSEFGGRPHVASLATVDAAGHPQVRSVVIRELSADGSLRFVTDARSEKIGELAGNPNVQLLFWFASQRVQYRLSGEARREIDLSVIQSHWSRLSEPTKGMFFWGVEQSCDVEAAKTQAAEHGGVPGNFAVYRVYISKLDFLSLNETPHTRWIAREIDGWNRQAVDP